MDFVADLHHSQVAPLTARLADQFYADEERIRHAVARRSSFNVIHLKRHFKLDVYLLRADPFSAAELRRAETFQIGPQPQDRLRVATAEDVVLQKLRWYRQGGELSERQWLDVLGVLKVQKPTIDRAYMDGWAVELGVADLLARACAESGYPPRS